jgi:hypothetical protein
MEAETLDHDQDVEEEEAAFEAVGPGSDDTVPLADFPAGAKAGQLVHDIFEHIDFRREDPPSSPGGRSPSAVPSAKCSQRPSTRARTRRFSERYRARSD